MRVLVAGAGLAGSTVARVLAEAGHDVLVRERREHVAGNAFDETDRHGLLVHRYGPHIFHTNSDLVWQWLSRFTAWRPYEHRVLAEVEGRRYPIPINRTTINQLYGLELDEAGVAEYLRGVQVVRGSRRTSEDVVLAQVGHDLCERFFRGYTRKQWGRDLSELGPGVAARIPVRTNDDDRYFTDVHQAMPAHGYTAMVTRMLDHPAIVVEPGRGVHPGRLPGGVDHLVWTGPVDEYFGYAFGALPYRSLRFEHEHVPGRGLLQPVGTINVPGHGPGAPAHTRTTEFRHLTGQQHTGSSLVREYPCEQGDPYYPVPMPASRELYHRYEQAASRLPAVSFVGRLAQYRYLNMDQAVAAALASARAVLDVWGGRPSAAAVHALVTPRRSPEGRPAPVDQR